jgi:hypothetical protein
MNRDVRDLLLSLGIVAATAAYGLFQRKDSENETATTSVAARVVDQAPDRATVLSDDGFFDRVPGVADAIRRAVRTDARDEWRGVDIDGRDALELVDLVQNDLPYYVSSPGETHESGVYVEYGGTTVVVTAVGWERIGSLPQ